MSKQSNKDNGYFIYMAISELLSLILCSKRCSENRVVYEIMCKDKKESDRPHVTL
jgi:hypothetical protein